jgi:MFS family permease
MPLLKLPTNLTTSGKVLFLLCLMYFVTYLDRVAIGTAAPIIKAEMNLSTSEVGLIFSAFAYPYAVFQLFGGWMADKWGARQTLFLCGLIWGTATMLTGLAGSLVSLFLVRVMLGFGEGATFPTATRAMQSWVAVEKRGFAQGLAHAFARFANAVAPPLMVVLIGSLTWRGSFVSLGIISLLWTAVWLWYFCNDPAQHKAITKQELVRLPPHDPVNAGQAWPPVPWIRLTARMFPVTVTYFCYGWSLWVYINWLPSFFKEGYGLDLGRSALFASGVFLAGVVGDTLGGVISDFVLRRTGDLRKARRNVIVAGMLGAAICLTGVYFSKHLTLIAIMLSGGFFFLELVIGPIWSVPMDIAPQYAGSASGLMNLGSAVAAIISPLVFGTVVDLSGNWVLPLSGSSGLLLIGAVSAFGIHPERRFVEVPAGMGHASARAK